MQVSERAGTSLTGRARTLDAQLADLDAAVAAGNSRSAAALLSELGSVVQRDCAAAAFAEAVRTRALAEQAAVLLHAHASLLAHAAS